MRNKKNTSQELRLTNAINKVCKNFLTRQVLQEVLSIFIQRLTIYKWTRLFGLTVSYRLTENGPTKCAPRSNFLPITSKYTVCSSSLGHFYITRLLEKQTRSSGYSVCIELKYKNIKISTYHNNPRVVINIYLI